MKIKKKVKMNLHELIQWAWENDVKGKTFKSNRGKKVKFYSIGGFNVLEPIWGHDTFTVEVEELITERTVIPLFLEVYEYEGELVFLPQKEKSIKDLLEESDLEESITTKTLYIINDDGTLTLVWKDGEMVE
ncbi:hypothetical protein CVM49_03355 [Staphylococcus pseudintermedius]|uniref:hypothetical protein n=1 Tax=Staphylococcus pseudintermedius TaxID=283734 RepID=UPI000BBB9ECF|nr:hypothetical protein [Staphylococcus pseudintermedius]EGQ1672828.1 hypothetical protein [Staphylococcus pseudintermedius]EGQ2766562.1 hypothetical protein [Staphylococcus pseudintermedius]EGQ3162913.1 hypothetical protein [Staphylococcus pseudintermedius]EGQ3202770.1 hypothetical protein [Staphylococcus pseudintermedius]EGQ3221784.1 hypothetical protein [Staphylococcus pseudintermedius]